VEFGVLSWFCLFKITVLFVFIGILRDNDENFQFIEGDFMKRFICLFVFSVLAAVGVQTFAAVPNDWNIGHLKGKVQTIEEETAAVKNNKESSRYSSGIIKYDENGRIIYEWLRFGKNDLPRESFFNYDNDKRFIKGIDLFPKMFQNDENDYRSYSLRNYSGNENMLTDEFFLAFSRIGETKMRDIKYRFDGEGRLMDEIQILYNPKGFPRLPNSPQTLTVTHTYTDGEYLPAETKSVIAGENNLELTKKFTYRLDNQGNWIKRTAEFTDKNNKTITEITYRKIKYFE